jgi:hypothetical protein
LLTVLLIFFGISFFSISSGEVSKNISLPIPIHIFIESKNKNSITTPLTESVLDLISNGKKVPKWLRHAKGDEQRILVTIETLKFKNGFLSDKAEIVVRWFFGGSQTDWIILKEKTFNFRSGFIYNRVNTDDFMSETKNCVKFLLRNRGA